MPDPRYVHRGGPGWSGRWSAGVWAGAWPAAPQASAPEPRGGLCGWCTQKCAWWDPRPAEEGECIFVINDLWTMQPSLNHFLDIFPSALHSCAISHQQQGTSVCLGFISSPHWQLSLLHMNILKHTNACFISQTLWFFCGSFVLLAYSGSWFPNLSLLQLFWVSLKKQNGWIIINQIWLSPTVSQSSFSMSTKTLISSGMAMAGWVSFNWMATWKTRQSEVTKLSPYWFPSYNCTLMYEALKGKTSAIPLN